MSQLRPLGDRVLVRALEHEPKTKSGIVLPDSSQERSGEATVIAVGKGKYVDGKLVPIEVAVGDVVLYSEYAGQKVKLDDEELQILRSDDILAILEK